MRFKEIQVVYMHGYCEDVCAAHPKDRKAKNIVLDHTIAKHPVDFAKAQEFGFPNNTQIVELPLSLLG